MITHTAQTLLIMSQQLDLQRHMECFWERIPWILLPDAIQMYVGRQASHFEVTLDEMDVSYIEFPTADVLSELNKENFSELVEFYVSPKVRQCAIGEMIDITEFDWRNSSHPFYYLLRINLLQDRVLDQVLRGRFVDVKGRFDDKFVVHHNRSIELDGAQLRQQVTKFKEIGFLYLAGKVYRNSGIILSQEWFEHNVHRVLNNKDSPYPTELAENTYKHMRIPEVINKRIQNLDFDLTDEDKDSVIITDNLEKVLDYMSSAVCQSTMSEMFQSF